MVYDSERGEAVLFGGRQTTASGTVWYGDTWGWNGKAWTLRASLGPPAQAYAAMAYDDNRRRIVLFPGLGSCGECLDTWE
ncbi:MAG: hypothetical protein JNM07_12610 [Phycisphaerae bacterium]|nr:hypothetical protein [Phycisphaerae bacterium]